MQDNQLKIHVLSDIHLEFMDFCPQKTDADVVVLAGDIGTAGVCGLSWARNAFPYQEIVYVAGNHEFYGGNRQTVLADMRDRSKEQGIHFLENDQVVLGGVRFLGATLWTDFEYFGEGFRDIALHNAKQLNDFYLITEDTSRTGVSRFRPVDSMRLNQTTVSWLSEQLSEKCCDEWNRTVVVTHHLPTSRSVGNGYKNGVLTPCFASNLERLMVSDSLVLWIHGHTHDSCDYDLLETRLVCNPRGYAPHDTNPNFEEQKIVEV